MDKLLLILFIILTIVIILYLKNNPHITKNILGGGFWKPWNNNTKKVNNYLDKLTELGTSITVMNNYHSKLKDFRYNINPDIINKLNISNQEILKQNSNVMLLINELSNIKNENHLNHIKAGIDDLSRYIKQIINMYFRTINENLRSPYFYKIIRTSESISSLIPDYDMYYYITYITDGIRDM